MDSNQGGADGSGASSDLQGASGPEQVSPDLAGVRSGDLAPYEERAPYVPTPEGETAISPRRAIPPDEIHALLERFGHVHELEAMIPVFQEIQTRYGYITQAAASQVASELGLAEAEVYGVLTFYSFFRFSPRGGHVIMTCEGTGCYVRGAAKLRETIENRLNVGPGGTTEDGVFTFEPQSICLGACDLGPLVEIESAYYTHVTPEKMEAILTQWAEAGDEKPVGDNVTGGHAPDYEETHGFGPSLDELYAGYELEKFMGQGARAAQTSEPAQPPSSGKPQA
jgi:NADH:ubiquinone oxidoreductase subunit E